MPSDVLAFAVVAAVVVSFSTLSRGREISNNALRRSERQAPGSDTQPEKLEDYCELPPPLEHGRFSPSQRRCPSLTSSPACHMIPGTPVPPNWVIFHSCLPGYKQQDGKTLSVCVKGKWIPPLPVCEVDGCYLPETPTQGSYKAAYECRPHEVGLDVCNSRPGTLVPHSWTIEYSCNPNYYLNTTSEFSSCDNATRTWTNPVECQDGSPPEIYADTTEVETNEGHFATLRCSARGNPIPTIYWMKAGKSLSDKGGRYKFLSDGSLQIVGLVASDAGEYICVAYNGVGGPVKKIFNLMILLAEDSKWNTTNLTYRVSQYPTSLPKAQVDQALAEALQMWSNITSLKFTMLPQGPVHIDVKFVKGAHSPLCPPFDGPGGMISHADYPKDGGSVHFDDDETWTLGSDGFNLRQLAVHEFGHALGLKHSEDIGSVMSPNFSKLQNGSVFSPNFKLHPNDIKSIQLLYGNAETPTRHPAEPGT